jgi:hypothetical protein
MGRKAGFARRTEEVTEEGEAVEASNPAGNAIGYPAKAIS